MTQTIDWYTTRSLQCCGIIGMAEGNLWQVFHLWPPRLSLHPPKLTNKHECVDGDARTRWPTDTICITVLQKTAEASENMHYDYQLRFGSIWGIAFLFLFSVMLFFFVFFHKDNQIDSSLLWSNLQLFSCLQCCIPCCKGTHFSALCHLFIATSVKHSPQTAGVLSLQLNSLFYVCSENRPTLSKAGGLTVLAGYPWNAR